MTPLAMAAWCVGWTVWCGVLAHILEQPREADMLATFIGILSLIAAVASL